MIDPLRPQKCAIITHGHADHARSGHDHVIATPETIDIMKIRYGENCAEKFTALPYRQPLDLGPVQLTFHPAGHILGSAQALLEYRGERVVMTGDYKTRPDKTCAPFELVPCDLFITEATFGLPVFKHPDPLEEIKKVLYSLEIEPDRPHIIGAYALGKAQRVISLVRQSGYNKPIYLHGAQVKLCKYYQDQGIELGELIPASTEKDRQALNGEIIIAPPSALQDKWARRFDNPVLCFASGWMQVKQRAKQRGINLPLIISDHADWQELTDTIAATGASKVWITHGREDALIHHCTLKGIYAEPLNIQGREDEEALSS